MRLGELLLRKLSRDPGTDDYRPSGWQSISGNELSLLRREYPNLSSLVSGKVVLDYGCGKGKQSLALSMEEDCFVYGLDTNSTTLSTAKELASSEGIDETSVVFSDKVPDNLIEKFDVVISQNSMEHFADPVSAIAEMKRLIHRKGRILITFGPPWFSPYGSHTHYFCKVPWINILFSEKSVMRVRSLYRSDGAKRYEDVESGLNKMTLRYFNQIITEQNLNVERITYNAVKGQNWIARIPLVRELFVNHVTCILGHCHPVTGK